MPRPLLCNSAIQADDSAPEAFSENAFITLIDKVYSNQMVCTPSIKKSLPISILFTFSFGLMISGPIQYLNFLI